MPEQHLVGLAIGALLQVWFGGRLFAAPLYGYFLGVPLIVIGLALSVWSVRQAGETDIRELDRLLTTGPYALSRHPMYVAWALKVLGAGLAANSPWITALLPVLIAYTHFVDVRAEERHLEEQYPEAYSEYRRRVRRYF